MSLFVLCYDIWRTGDITTVAVIHPVFESDYLFPEHAGRGWKHFRFRMIRRVTVHTTPTSRIYNYLSKGYDQKCVVWRDNIELITIESFSNVLCVCECQSLAQTKTWMVPIQCMHTAVNALHPAKTSASLLVPASTSANQSLVSFQWALVLTFWARWYSVSKQWLFLGSRAVCCSKLACSPSRYTKSRRKLKTS